MLVDTPTPEPYTRASSSEDSEFGLGAGFSLEETAVDNGAPDCSNSHAVPMLTDFRYSYSIGCG